MNPSVEIQDLSFSYNGIKQILSIKNFSVLPGEKVFIYGNSGSGKSTLLNLISGVLKPNRGNINLLGQEVGKLSIGKRDRFRGDHIGFIFQSFNLIPYLTIYENILLPLKTSSKRNSKVRANLREEITRISKHLNIDSYLDKRVTELSVGQQQRVAVARALIGSPEIIIADEPTSSLDENVTESFMKLLLQEHESKNFTLLFVSHDRRLAKYFDREISLTEINSEV